MSFHALVQKFQLATQVVKKQIQVAVAVDDFHTLKQGSYSLCVSKKMAASGYSVIWLAYPDFLPNNQFSWTPDFWVFGANHFEEGKQVFQSTNVQAIGLGETCTLDQQGWLGPAATEGDQHAYTFSSNYEPGIYPGMTQLYTGWDGVQKSAPSFLDPNLLLFGNRILKPLDTISLWWQQDVETGQMIHSTPSHSIELDLSQQTSIRVEYASGEWKKVAS